MKIHIDQHIHSDFSSDSDAPMETILQQAGHMGFTKLCFTDHMDYDFPLDPSGMTFTFSPERYFEKISQLRRQHPDFSIRAGVELGLKDGIVSKCTQLTAHYPFDFVIGSTHLVDNMDPYYREYWEAVGEEEGIRRYYETTYANLCHSFDFDVYGHIDYIIRYCPTFLNARKERKDIEHFVLSVMKKNEELIDAVFTRLIALDKGIEINTGGFKYGLSHPNPHEMLLSRYHALGGRLLTIGSDAHTADYVGSYFDRIPHLMQAAGFDTYYEYVNRTPIPVSLHTL